MSNSRAWSISGTQNKYWLNTDWAVGSSSTDVAAASHDYASSTGTGTYDTSGILHDTGTESLASAFQYHVDQGADGNQTFSGTGTGTSLTHQTDQFSNASTTGSTDGYNWSDDTLTDTGGWSHDASLNSQWTMSPGGSWQNTLNLRHDTGGESRDYTRQQEWGDSDPSAYTDSSGTITGQISRTFDRHVTSTNVNSATFDTTVNELDGGSQSLWSIGSDGALTSATDTFHATHAFDGTGVDDALYTNTVSGSITVDAPGTAGDTSSSYAQTLTSTGAGFNAPTESQLTPPPNHFGIGGPQRDQMYTQLAPSVDTDSWPVQVGQGPNPFVQHAGMPANADAPAAYSGALRDANGQPIMLASTDPNAALAVIPVVGGDSAGMSQFQLLDANGNPYGTVVSSGTTNAVSGLFSGRWQQRQPVEETRRTILAEIIARETTAISTSIQRERQQKALAPQLNAACRASVARTAIRHALVELGLLSIRRPGISSTRNKPDLSKN